MLSRIETDRIFPKDYMAICPKCNSNKVVTGGLITTLLWHREEDPDPNRIYKDCECQACACEFVWWYQYSWRTQSVWHWYTIDGEIIKGEKVS